MIHTSTGQGPNLVRAYFKVQRQLCK